MTFTLGSVSPRCWGNDALSQDWGSLPFHSGDWVCVAHIVLHVPPSGATETLPTPCWTPSKALQPLLFTIQAAVSCRLQLAKGTIVLIGSRYWMVCVLDRWILTRWTLVPTHGWQFFVAQASERHFRTEVLWPRLAPTQQAFMRSQSGPFAGLPFLAVPSSPFSRFPPQLFACFSRRLWLPLPLSSRTCRCGRPLDVLGHHRAACSRAGVLASRGFSVALLQKCAGRQVPASPPTCSGLGLASRTSRWSTIGSRG